MAAAQYTCLFYLYRKIARKLFCLLHTEVCHTDCKATLHWNLIHVAPLPATGCGY